MAAADIVQKLKSLWMNYGKAGKRESENRCAKSFKRGSEQMQRGVCNPTKDLHRYNKLYNTLIACLHVKNNLNDLSGWSNVFLAMDIKWSLSFSIFSIWTQDYVF